ncbi:hotdog fold thioesterase [Sneathiella chungangensis]|uniref:Hotdog fold thioesterase n=1 Tax=Sneathiella chungangensis TaxID=1418234 RepID=A0A845MCN5_9PROT|nr:PaaI family thioesterase [Sneathiella chungangensis]MZR21452.1 hotdog fold thioesterase [Sneathiella chungangensis]
MTEISLDRGRRVLAEQPFSVLIGSALDRLEAGQAELSLTLRDDHLQQHGFAHGGVVSYLADNALTYAGGTVLGDSVTLEFKINYVRPAIGEKLIARARVKASGKSQAVCDCDVYAIRDGVEKLCATAQGTIWKVSA